MAAGEGEEGVIEVGMAFVADNEASELVEPSEGSLDHQPVLSKVLTCFDAAPGDAGDDASGSQIAATAGIVVALVGVQFVRPLSRPSAHLTDWLKRVDGLGPGLAVMNIRPGQDEGERQAVTVDQRMALRAGFAAVGWVRADRVGPFWREWPRVGRCARPVDFSSEIELLQEAAVQGLPHAGGLPRRDHAPPQKEYVPRGSPSGRKECRSALRERRPADARRAAGRGRGG